MPHNFNKQKASNKASVTSDNRLPGRPRARFVLAHHPDSWEFIDGAWLPQLKTIPLIPGVNGCRQGPDGHLPVLVALRQDRWTPIDDQIAIKITDPDTGKIVDDAGYLLEWEGRRGPHYSDAWCTPMLLGSGRNASVDWSTGFDVAGYNVWRLWLVESGTIEKPSPAVMAQLLKVQEKRASRRINESHDGNPHIQAHVKAEMDKLEAMRSASNGADKKRRPVKGRGRKASNKEATNA